jgi:SAM-dependent methyltransferase
MIQGSLTDSPAAIPAASTGSREAQAKLWGTHAEAWAATEIIFSAVYESALERLRIRQGDRLLDIGCGAGGFCGLAHAKGASVVGLDATPELLAVAKSRYPECTFDEGEMETLPYRNAEFDFVTAFNSIQFATNPQTAIYEAKRTMKVGGLLLVTVWGPPQQCDSAAFLEELKKLAAPPADARGPFSLSEIGVLEGLIENVRLDIVDAKEVECIFAYPDEDAALNRMLSAGPAARAISEVGEDKVKAAALNSLQPFKTPEGGYRLRNVFRYVVAEV